MYNLYNCLLKLVHKISSDQFLLLAYIMQVTKIQHKKKNIKVCWFIFWVVHLCLESQENTCSHTSVSTCNMLETTIAKAVNVYIHWQLENVS